MSKKSVLIAEDDELLRDLYQKKFSAAGFDVRVAKDGDEAINLIEAKKPHLLVLDLDMPEKDGFEVLKKFPLEQREFSIVMLTNFIDQTKRKQAKELGANGYLAKRDLTISALIETVEELLSK